jgi:TnpA family transposase
MVTVNETAYPRLLTNTLQRDIKRLYTPTKKEWLWVKSRKVDKNAWLGNMVLLKCFQRLGYFPKLDDITDVIVNHIAQQLQIDPPNNHRFLFSSEKSSNRAKDAIRKYRNVQKIDTPEQKEWLITFSLDMAETKDNAVDIINAMIEILLKERFELPGFSTLERIASSSRAEINKEIVKRVSKTLSLAAKNRLQSLLEESNEQGQSLWLQLKQEPKRPTSKTLKLFLVHTQWINELQQTVGALPDIPEEKRQQLINEAKAYDIDRMKAISNYKRFTLLALLVNEQFYFATDCVVDMFNKEVRKLHNRAKIELSQFQNGAVKESEVLITLLKDVAIIMAKESGTEEKVISIDAAFEHDSLNVVKRCDHLVLYGFDNYLQFLGKCYSGYLRNVLLDSLELLEINHTTHDGDLLTCLKFILNNRKVKSDEISVKSIALNNLGENKTVIDWISAKWSKLVFKDIAPNIINRQLDRTYFEIAVISEMAQRFKSGDMYVLNSIKYDDYRSHLVSWDVFDEEIERFSEQVGISCTPSDFVSGLKEDFLALADKANDHFPKDSFVTLEAGELILKKRPPKVKSKDLAILDKAIKANMPEIDIIDLLVDTTKWVPLKQFFRPLSGHQTKIKNYDKHLVANLFCYGCNLGPTATARSLQGMTRKQIANLSLNHIREKGLVKATEHVINTYNEYELPGYWGTGESASVDGTRFDMYEQNLVSEYHVRYASYGGIGYYLVSDKYIALFSRFIPCGVREYVHLLDGIMENDSDIQPSTVHGDTHAQGTVIFGLAHLLGIKLMPRIKDIKSLIFFKPDKHVKYKHIDDLFSESINWPIINDNLNEMLRIAVSIKMGKVSASTIIRRLGTESVRNQLFYAFRELGRTVRTMFLLDYISDIEMRETIHAATCKSEEYNNFMQWVFFYNNGVIRENQLHEQNKIIKFNHLVSNMVILHNVNTMTNVLRKLQRKGVIVTSELLAGLSPYRWEHINLLGHYQLTTNKKTKARYTKLT